MTINNILELVQAISPHAFSDKVILTFINEIEGKIQTDVLRIQPDDEAFVIHTLDNIEEEETVVSAPHDKLYVPYVCSRVCESEGEVTKGNNHISRFNDFYDEFAKWLKRNYNPSARLL